MNTDTNEFAETCSAREVLNHWALSHRRKKLPAICSQGYCCHMLRLCFGGNEMRKLFVVLFITLIAVARAASQTSSAGAAATILTVIRAGSLIDGTSDAARQNQLIFVRGERIEKVADASATIPANAKVIDLSGVTVLPGLIDAHTHIFLWGENPEKGGYDANILKAGIALRAARATFACRRSLEQGFTTLRDLETEGAGYGDIEIKQAIEEGTIPGPRIFGATRAISTTGGYNLEGYAPELDMPKGAQLVDGPVEARKAARQQLEHGADWIKVYMTHRSWVDKEGKLVSQPTLTVEELQAVVDEAHGWQKKVACHAYNGIGLQRALDGGCDSIEHGLEITDEQIAQEFKRMVSMGMAPMDAIQSATSRSAEMLDMKGEIGVIAAGAYAEVVAVSGDPLKDVGELEHVRFVMHNGAVFKNDMA